MLIFGAKRWALLPPYLAQYSTVPAQQWFRKQLPQLIRRSQAEIPESLRANQQSLPPGAEIIQCVQKSGEAIYVPEGWGHAILNLLPRCVILHIDYQSRAMTLLT
jgi:hypothetical protein